jgi:hypothetical protein
MTPARHRIRIAALASLIAGLALVATTAGPAAAAKKKGKGGGNVDVTTVVNLPIPEATENGSFDIPGILRSTIDVGKQFRGRQIRDVNVTVQTLGTSGTNPVPQLQAKLYAPNGGHVTLFNGLFPQTDTTSLSLGPLTLDDESPLSLGIENPHSPTQLYAPWAGRARPNGKPLSVMDGGPVRGTWTLVIADGFRSGAGDGTSNLVSWRLEVVAARPFQTK